MSLPTVLARCLIPGLIVTALLMAAQTAPAEESDGFAEEPFSPAIDPARPLVNGPHTLPQLIAFALAHNPEISATAFDGEAAAARTEAAQGAFLPRVSIEGGYTYYGDDLRLTAARYNGEPGVFGDNILTTDLVLRLPLYTGGRLTAEMRAAELLEASAGQRLARSEGELVYNVSILYFSQLAQTQLIEALRFSVETLTAQLNRVKALIAGRKVAQVDALRTEVKLADVRQRLLREQNNLRIQRQALLNLLGAGGAAPDFALAGTLTLPPAERRTLAALVEMALLRRPDVQATQAEVAAQGQRVTAAQAAHWPTVNLVGAVGVRAMQDPTEQPPGQDTRNDASRIGITVEIPLFEGGRTTARVNEENAKLNAQRDRLGKLQLQIRLEVETAYANLASNRERFASAGKAVVLATESQHIEQEKYALGRGIVLDVLDAQSALLEAQATQIRALADANAAAAQLALATGENLP